ncbi:hypothetical protein [Hymenobacter sp. BT190]|uniref:hypothetical protein n=1 Tax=Hymenobacter sp. BT190 TaxID=2763505 RepID=UPI0021C66F6A|nr:hypothetical protein [Hymenobacter sp. BT190]
MRPHSGMRPQDIVVLLELAVRGYSPTSEQFPKGLRFVTSIKAKELSSTLQISEAEIGHSIRRSRFAGLLIGSGRLATGQVARQALYEFLIYGIKYVFPVKPGHLTRGVPTAHSAPPLSDIIQATEQYVWPHEEGEVRGQAIEPLFRTVPDVVVQNEQLYQLLALTDALRVGRSREINLAREELKRLLRI